MRILTLFVLILLLLPGCVSSKPDSLLVNAERSAAISLASFEAVVNFDHENLELMKSKAPAVHEVIQELRVKFPPAYRAVRAATIRYKREPTLESAHSLDRQVLELERLAHIARQALTAARYAEISPSTVPAF